MALEEMGMYFRSLSQYQQEPFDLSFNVEDMPTGGDVAMLPVKMSIGYNLARSAWWGSKAIGMNPFSRLTNPFNPDHLQWRYRSKTIKGFSGRLLEGIGNNVGGIKSWLTGKPRPGADDAIPWYRRAVYSFDRENAIYKDIAAGKGAPHAVKSMGLGALDRYLLRPYEMHNQMSRIHSAFRTAVTADEMGEMMLSNLYEASALRGTKGQTLTRAGKLAVSNMDEVTDILSSRQYKFMKFSGIDQFDFRSPGSTPQMVKGKLDDMIYNFGFDTVDYERGFVDKGRRNFLKASRGTKVSVFDLITGKAGGFERRKGEGYFSSRWRYAKEGIGFGYDDQTRRKLVLYHTRNKSTRKLFQQYTMAQDKTYQQAAIKAARKSSDDVLQQFKTYTSFMDDMSKNKVMMQRNTFSMLDRVRNARALKMVTGAGVALATTAWLTRSIVQGALTIPGRVASTMQDLIRPEFGSGEVLSNARVSTERQRAIQAIQNSHMNARYLLGGEASMYH